MLSHGVSEQAGLAVVKSSLEIKKQLCRGPAIAEDKASKEGHKYFKGVPQSRVQLQILGLHLYISLCVYASLCKCTWLHFWLSIH